jgi:hypothetical protein
VIDTVLFFILAVTMTLHLAAVGIAGFGPLAALALQARRGEGGERTPSALGRRLVGHSMAALGIGMVLGAAVLGLSCGLYSTAFLDTFRAVPPSRLWFGAGELAFYFVCLVPWWALWGRPGTRYWGWFCALLATTNLLYHFPPLFSALAALEGRPHLATQGSSFASLFLDAEVLARTIHHLLAGLVATGLWVMWVASRSEGPGSYLEERRPEEGRRAVAFAARVALAAALSAMPAGVYLLVCLPASHRDRLLGGDPFSTVLVGGSIVAGLGLLHQLAAAAFGAAEPPEIRRAFGLLGLTVLLMVATRQSARHRHFESIRPARPAAQAIIDAAVRHHAFRTKAPRTWT